MRSPTPLNQLANALASRYRIEREVGQGGMATVYLAQDLKLDRPVAIKVLRPELAAVLGRERFLAEIKITARLDHPHILTLIDSGANDGFLYYVLPFVQGESLRDRLNREKQLRLEDALDITKQVASALDHAHRHGVIHRDVKPENILLREGGVVLADFGIALAVKEAGGNRLTDTGISLGTPQYMSPEQATGDRTLDARSDVYSLAAVLYEMLAGEPPVTGPNAQAMIAKLMTERPTRLRVVRDTVPEGIDTAVAKALSKVPADRFPSAGEFARRLVRSDAATSANGRTRQRWTFAVVGVLVLALGLAILPGRRRPPPVVTAFTPQFEQLTTDGNARRAVLSPDGTRLAFVARDCDPSERCTERLMVRDIGNAGSITVLKGTTIWSTDWAAEGRFLVAGVTEGGRASIVAVSALGGEQWSLPGFGAATVGVTDTVYVSPGFLRSGDSVAWLRVVTVSDGLVRDSIAIRRPALFHIGLPAPVGGRIALASSTETGTEIHLMDRAGHITASLPPLAPGTIRAFHWTPQADAVLWQVELGGGHPRFGDARGPPMPSVVVRRRVNPDGKFAETTDTLLRLEPGNWITQLRADGSALVSRGPVETVVYALERSGPGRLDFRSRRFDSSTAGLQALLSRDGATVWLRHGGSGPGSPRRNEFRPFAGGALRRPFNLPPGDEIYSDWSRPVSTRLLYALRDSSGRARLVEIDVATGQSRGVTDLPERTAWIFTIPGGGYGIGDYEAHSARVVGRPGMPDTTWTVPGIAGRRTTVVADVASDGAAFFEFSQSEQGDTVWLRRVPLDGSDATPAVPALWDTWLGIFPDGSVETGLSDPAGGLGWYWIAPGGNRSVRLGDAPVQGAGTKWSSSDDGRRFIVVKPVDRPDVFLLRNFGELLRR